MSLQLNLKSSLKTMINIKVSDQWGILSHDTLSSDTAEEEEEDEVELRLPCLCILSSWNSPLKEYFMFYCLRSTLTIDHFHFNYTTLPLDNWTQKMMMKMRSMEWLLRLPVCPACPLYQLFESLSFPPEIANIFRILFHLIIDGCDNRWRDGGGSR